MHNECTITKEMMPTRKKPSCEKVCSQYEVEIKSGSQEMAVLIVQWQNFVT